MTQKTDPYIDFLAKLIGALAAHQAKGDEITAWMCVSQLDPSKDNRKMRQYATDTLKVEAQDYAAAMKRRCVELSLGEWPLNAEHFVEIVTRRDQTTVAYNGVITQGDDSGINFGMLRTKLRDEAVDKLQIKGLTAARINDAADLWFERAKAARLPILRSMIAYDPDCADAGYAALWRMAETCFEDDPAFVVACFQKFMQQCKQKMNGLEVCKHLMLVLLGKQGGGKSVLIKKLIAKVKEISTACSFVNMTDDKIIEIWRNYIGFLDEMIGGSKADMQVVKNAITADVMPRRPMTTNAIVHVPQNLTFIGTSNAEELQEIIRDSTGTRRFVGLNCKDMLDWKVVNATDWLTVWRSVDETAADPMAAFADVMAATQEAQRYKSRSEEWHAQARPRRDMHFVPGQRVTSQKLFENFGPWEAQEYPGDRPTNKPWFCRMLKVVPNCMFKKARRDGWWIFDPDNEGFVDDDTVPPDDVDAEPREMEKARQERIVRMRVGRW